MRYEGIVFKIYPKTFKGIENYSIKLDGQPLYHRCGPKRYAGIAEPGNRIAFDAEPNPDGQSAKVTSDPVLVKAEPLAAPGAPSASYGSSGLQMRYQGALDRAISFVDLAIRNGAIKLPVKTAGILAVLEAAVDRYTALYFEDTNSLGAVVREAEGTGEEKAPVKAAAEDEADEE